MQILVIPNRRGKVQLGTALQEEGKWDLLPASPDTLEALFSKRRLYSAVSKFDQCVH